MERRADAAREPEPDRKERGLLRSREIPVRTTFLELLFDLVYVFAFAQLSRYLVGHLNWLGAGRTLLILLPLWWLWTSTVWLTDAVEPAHVLVQIHVFVSMAGIMLMGASIPRVFGPARHLFAGIYVGVLLGSALYYGFLLRKSEQRRASRRTLFWYCLAAVPWTAGAFAKGVVTAVCWGIGSILDYLGPRLRWPTPRIGRSTPEEFRPSAEHVSERYRQFFIIALGETILTSGLALSRSAGAGMGHVLAFLTAFASTVLLARIYIYRAGQLLEAALAHAPEPARPGEVAAFDHLIMIAGIVVTAAGDDVVIAHPLGETSAARVTLILSGPGLFLAGRALFDYTVFSRISWSRLIGLAVIAAGAAPLLLAPPLAAALFTVAVLAGVVAANAISWRRSPLRPSPPVLLGDVAADPATGPSTITG